MLIENQIKLFFSKTDCSVICTM